MSPQPRRRSGAPVRVALAVVAVLVAISGCGAAFDPTGPCAADGKVPGAYPELEALVPKTYDGAAPAQLDSGRTCTTEGLGTLATHGVKEMRFAGGTWSIGTQSGLTLATFTSVDGPPLQALWLSDFYETTARSGKKVQSVDAIDVPIGALAGRRLDVLNDESFQTVVVWNDGDRVLAVLVADFIREIQTREAHDKIVASAVATLAEGRSGG